MFLSQFNFGSPQWLHFKDKLTVDHCGHQSTSHHKSIMHVKKMQYLGTNKHLWTLTASNKF